MLKLRKTAFATRPKVDKEARAAVALASAPIEINVGPPTSESLHAAESEKVFMGMWHKVWKRANCARKRSFGASNT